MKIDKNTIYLSSITFGLILISILGLSYVMSKTAEQKIYMTINSYVGQKGSFIQGLSLKFDRDDISCLGLVSFDCKIQNPILYVPSKGLDLFTAKEIEIGTFSRNGINIRQRNLNFYIKGKDIKYIDGNPLVTNMTKKGKEISSKIYPFNIEATMNIKRFSNGEADGKIDFAFNSKIANLSFNTDIDVIESRKIVYLDNKLHLVDELNATAGAKLGGKFNTLLNSFSIKTENKDIFNFLYLVYEYYYTGTVDKDKQKQINLDFLNKDTFEKLTKVDFKKEFKNRLLEMIPDAEEKELKEYIDSLIYLVMNEKSYTTISGTNKDNYTVEELSVLKRLDKLNKPWDYYNLKIKTGETK